MRLGFLRLPPDERRLYIEQAAMRRNVSPVLLEKDFWVCWMLAVLFASKFADALVFKGGTSLSKVFGVIDRFSEDIDLSLSPDFLGLTEAGTSRNQANKWMKAAEAACGAVVQNTIAPGARRRGGGGARREGGGVVRVPDGSRHELAGALVPLPDVATSRVRLPQAFGEARIRFAHGPATGGPSPGASVGGRGAAGGIPRLAM